MSDLAKNPEDRFSCDAAQMFCFQHVGADVDKAVKEVLKTAVANLKLRYPWYFTSHHQELSNAVKELNQNKASLHQFDDWFKTGVSNQVKQSFHDTNAYQHVNKVLQTMKIMVRLCRWLFFVFHGSILLMCSLRD